MQQSINISLWGMRMIAMTFQIYIDLLKNWMKDMIWLWEIDLREEYNQVQCHFRINIWEILFYPDWEDYFSGWI